MFTKFTNTGGGGGIGGGGGGVAEENDEENGYNAKPYPSSTRLSKVRNWMKDFKPVPEKRRSVITVIGQTQSKPYR